MQLHCVFRLTNAFVDSSLSSELEEAIFDELSIALDSPTSADGVRFAVRSSAVGEDSDDLSSAGQNETYLGCKGRQAIIEAIKKCWASLFTYQSVEYRRYLNLGETCRGQVFNCNSLPGKMDNLSQLPWQWLCKKWSMLTVLECFLRETLSQEILVELSSLQIMDLAR